MLTAAEALLIVPHLHDGANHSLGFAVGLRAIDTRKFLSDAKSLTGLNKLMVLIRTLINELGEKSRRAMLCAIRKNRRVQLPGEVVYRYKQVLPTLCLIFTFQYRQALGVKVHKLAGVGLVVASSLCL